MDVQRLAEKIESHITFDAKRCVVFYNSLICVCIRLSLFMRHDWWLNRKPLFRSIVMDGWLIISQSHKELHWSISIKNITWKYMYARILIFQWNKMQVYMYMHNHNIIIYYFLTYHVNCYFCFYNLCFTRLKITSII